MVFPIYTSSPFLTISHHCSGILFISTHRTGYHVGSLAAIPGAHSPNSRQGHRQSCLDFSKFWSRRLGEHCWDSTLKTQQTPPLTIYSPLATCNQRIGNCRIELRYKRICDYTKHWHVGNKICKIINASRTALKYDSTIFYLFLLCYLIHFFLFLVSNKVYSWHVIKKDYWVTFILRYLIPHSINCRWDGVIK
jgi:hypothetical protein